MDFTARGNKTVTQTVNCNFDELAIQVMTYIQETLGLELSRICLK